MTRRSLLVLAAIGAIFAVLFCGLPIAAILTEAPAATACTGDRSAAPTTVATWRGGPVGSWTAEEVANAAIIVTVGARLFVPPRGWIVAVATAMAESHLHNLPNLGTANDHDSLGLFQQRPSQGWGTPAQIVDPRYASQKFYEKLLTVNNWQTVALSQAAQAVQRSAFPDRYATFENTAGTLVAAITHVQSVTDLPGASLLTCTATGPVSSSGWTQPVHAGIVSGFRTPDRPNHDGDDLGATRGTTIRAAASGRVVWAGCDNDTGNCDIDGSPDVKGCGWFVEILHADNVATRYCHLVQQPAVTAGQTVAVAEPIGLVGTSGHSSGPHLHFEVHLNVSCGPTRCALTRANAVDPAPFMRNVGAPLGG
jgi:murein DD-endopeptidase MepM/ murein hydrolase activator NlpD